MVDCLKGVLMSYIIHLPIKPKYVELAQSLTSTESYNNNSITKGERNVLGMLGEICYVMMMSRIMDRSQIKFLPNPDNPNYDYDVKIYNSTFDVKTKQRTVQPRMDYDASIAAYSKDQQKCDYYAFTSITVSKNNPNKFLDFYYMGHIKKQNFFKIAQYKNEGDPDGDNIVMKNGKAKKFEITKDCYNLKYNQLEQFSMDMLGDIEASNLFKVIQL